MCLNVAKQSTSNDTLWPCDLHIIFIILLKSTLFFTVTSIQPCTHHQHYTPSLSNRCVHLSKTNNSGRFFFKYYCLFFYRPFSSVHQDTFFSMCNDIFLSHKQQYFLVSTISFNCHFSLLKGPQKTSKHPRKTPKSF